MYKYKKKFLTILFIASIFSTTQQTNCTGKGAAFYRWVMKDHLRECDINDFIIPLATVSIYATVIASYLLIKKIKRACFSKKVNILPT